MMITDILTIPSGMNKHKTIHPNRSDGQSDRYGAVWHDGDLNSGNEEPGKASDDEDEEDTDDEMEDGEAEFDGIPATSAVMKDVFLFPESIITISDTGIVFSKSNRCADDYSKPQPYQATTFTWMVKSHVKGYIMSPSSKAAPWIISAGITTVLLEIFNDSTFITAQTLTTGQWAQDGPMLWTSESFQLVQHRPILDGVARSLPLSL
jgi:hypothetical protein